MPTSVKDLARLFILRWLLGTFPFIAMLGAGPAAFAISPASISGLKFRDTNGNGFRDTGDPGLQGWTIQLINPANSNLLAQAVTDVNGNYTFSNLAPGSYRVREVPQGGWSQTTANPADMTLFGGQTVFGVNFGNFQRMSISGQKFQDINGNRVQDAGEAGLAGWTIQLLDGANRLLASTTTDVNGNYVFANLGPGTNRVRELAQAGWTQTTANPADIFAQSGVDVAGINFGNFQTIAISGQKFQDNDGNGIKDAGDAGLAGWTIQLVTNGVPFATAITDASGNYSFANLGPGAFRVREVTQAGWVRTTANPADIFVQSGVNVSGVDFGNFRMIAISGQKFQDTNGNGIKDAGEPGISGWPIQLLDGANRLLSSTGTDANGNYSFGNLGAGTYRVREVAQTGWTQTTADPADVAARSGVNVSGVDFGNSPADTIPPTITCPANITTVTDPGQCSAVVTYTPTVTDNRPGVTFTCNPPSGFGFPKGTTTVTCTATDTANNRSTCTFTVTVTDAEKPTIICPANITQSAAAGQCGAVVSYSATATDNCPGVTFSCAPASGLFFPAGTTTVICTATDAVGNATTCSFTVTVADRELPTILCPADIVTTTAPGQCSRVVNYPSPTVTDNCSGVTVACSPPSGSTFPKGTTTVVCTATDAAGNRSACTFNVTVNDIEPPTITCPADIVTATEPGRCSAVVNFPTPAATDNCDSSLAVTCNPPSGASFPIGPTRVTCTAVDAAGNKTTCTFTIQVNDVEPPKVICPANIVTSSAPGQCSAVVNYPAPAVTDNCDANPTVTCNPPSGSVFPSGTTTVTCTATDALGNKSSCTFTVIVNDAEPPRITCPAPITVTAAAGQSTTVVNYPQPTAVDTCDPKPTIACNPPSGASFPVGTTTVTCTATDVAGNATSCTFTVTVRPTGADLTLTKTSDFNQLAQGGNLTYTITLANIGPSSATGIIVRDTLPPGMTFVSATLDQGNCTPAPANERFLNQAYLDLLGRPIDSDARAVFLNTLNQGTTRGQVAQSILSSAEYRQSLVQGLYQRLLHRAADPAGLNAFVNQLAAGGTAEQVIANIAGSQEYFVNRGGGTNDGFLDALYNDLVNRPIDSSARTAFLQALSGGTTRVQVASSILSSQEYRRLLVQGLYLQFLRRAADSAGLNTFVNVLQEGRDEQVMASLLGSDEYFALAGGILTCNLSSLPNGATATMKIVVAPTLAGTFTNVVSVSANENDPNPANNTATASTTVNASTPSLSITDVSVLEGNSGIVSAAFTVTLSAPSSQIVTVDFGTADGTAKAGDDYVANSGTLVFNPGVTARSLVVVVKGELLIETDETFFVNLSNASNATIADAQGVGTIRNDDRAGTAPTIATQPQGRTVASGSGVSLSVAAIGTAPLTYQWRLNGVNLPGANSSTLTINNFQFANGGSYRVAVANAFGAAESDAAVLKPANLSTLALANNFVDRVTFNDLSRAGSSSNVGANKETNEPNHAGKPGGKSVWATWLAPANGVVTFGTEGSSFDTLLAVYTGDTLSSLVEVASDEDHGGFLTSRLSFNAVAGTRYQVAVDGFAATQGDIVLSWTLEPTAETVPLITVQPQSQIVGLGNSATFTVVTTGAGLSYQWFFNALLIPGATGPNLTINNVQPSDAGNYFVRLSRGARFVDSQVARLEINRSAAGSVVERVVTTDKFADLIRGLFSPFFGPPQLAGSNGRPRRKASLAHGYSGTQIFNTFGASKEPGEPNHCGIIGGASQWFAYQADSNGQLTVTTDGSDFDTVLAVYTGSGVDFASLVSVACDNDSGLDGKDSRVGLAATAGTIYYIVVDGVDAATGNVRLNYDLSAPPHLEVLSRSGSGFPGLKLSGLPARTYSVEGSADLGAWTELLTTNVVSGVFEFHDPAATGFGQRFYRAIMRP